MCSHPRWKWISNFGFFGFFGSLFIVFFLLLLIVAAASTSDLPTTASRCWALKTSGQVLQTSNWNNLRVVGLSFRVPLELPCSRCWMSSLASPARTQLAHEMMLDMLFWLVLQPALRVVQTCNWCLSKSICRFQAQYYLFLLVFEAWLGCSVTPFNLPSQVCWVQDCETRRLGKRSMLGNLPSRQKTDVGCSKGACQLPGWMMLGFSSFWGFNVSVPSPVLQVQRLGSHCPGNRTVGKRSSRGRTGCRKGATLTGNRFAVRFCRTSYIQFMSVWSQHVTLASKQFETLSCSCHDCHFSFDFVVPPRSRAWSAGHEQPPLGWHNRQTRHRLPNGLGKPCRTWSISSDDWVYWVTTKWNFKNNTLSFWCCLGWLRV